MECNLLLVIFVWIKIKLEWSNFILVYVSFFFDLGYIWVDEL